jgi:RNA polymerase sigma-70 factor (ECF subfamily)
MSEPPRTTTTDLERERNPRLQALLAGCASRDSRALEALYRDVSPLLYAALVHMLKRRPVAEEALQDVFVSIWERAGQYSVARGRPLAWMLSIARYRAIDLLRHERHAPELMPNPSDRAEGDGGLDSDQLDQPDSARFERCFSLLAPLQRECLELAFVGGNTHRDIARLTGNHLGSVKSWIRRGLESLRTCLQS